MFLKLISTAVYLTAHTVGLTLVMQCN